MHTKLKRGFSTRLYSKHVSAALAGCSEITGRGEPAARPLLRINGWQTEIAMALKRKSEERELRVWIEQMEAAETILADFFSGVRIVDIDEHVLFRMTGEKARKDFDELFLLCCTDWPENDFIQTLYVERVRSNGSAGMLKVNAKMFRPHQARKTVALENFVSLSKRTQYREPLLPTLSSQFLYSETRASISLKLKPWARLSTGKAMRMREPRV